MYIYKIYYVISPTRTVSYFWVGDDDQTLIDDLQLNGLDRSRVNAITRIGKLNKLGTLYNVFKKPDVVNSELL